MSSSFAQAIFVASFVLLAFCVVWIESSALSSAMSSTSCFVLSHPPVYNRSSSTIYGSFPCDVLEIHAEIQPVDNTFKQCRLKVQSAKCDGQSVSPMLFPAFVQCTGMRDRPSLSCPGSDTDAERLPLFQTESVIRKAGIDSDGSDQCDIQAKSRMLCGGSCVAAAVAHGLTNCFQPNATDFITAPRPC